MSVSAPTELVWELAERFGTYPWVTGLMVGGSLATGDHHPGVSDIDLVAVVDGPLDQLRIAQLLMVHRAIPRRAQLGCTYVDLAMLDEPSYPHPTWTHGLMIRRPLSGVVRADLVRHGYAVRGTDPVDLLGPVSDDYVRKEVRRELDGYWRSALRQPLPWWGRVHQDLALTTMARAHESLASGRLVTKTDAIELLPSLGVGTALVERVRRRRAGVRKGLGLRVSGARQAYSLTHRLVHGRDPAV